MPFIYFLQRDDDDDDDYNDDNDDDDDDANLTLSDDNVTEIYSLDSDDDDDNVEPVGIIYSNIFAHSRKVLNIIYNTCIFFRYLRQQNNCRKFSLRLTWKPRKYSKWLQMQ